MEYQLIPTVGDWNCWFSVVYASYGTHRVIRYKWLGIKNMSLLIFLIDYLFIIVMNTSTDGEYPGHVELECIIRLHPDIIFRVYETSVSDMNSICYYNKQSSEPNIG